MKNFFEYMLLLPAAGLAVPVLVDSALKGAILLAMVLAAVVLLRRGSAALRHLVLVVAMVGLLVLPVLSVSLPGWRVLPAWAQARVEEPATPSAPTGVEIGSDYVVGALTTSAAHAQPAADPAPAAEAGDHGVLVVAVSPGNPHPLARNRRSFRRKRPEWLRFLSTIARQDKE